MSWYGSQAACEQCGGPFIRKRTRDQRFCSQRCVGQSRVCPVRPCAQCGNPLSGSVRVYCSKSCAGLGRSAKRCHVILAGEKPCSRCGVSKAFDNFSPHAGGLGGVRSICKPCASAATMANRSPEANRRSSRSYAATPGGRAAKAAWSRAHPAYRMVSAACARASRSGLPFDICPDDIVVPDVCPVFGTPFTSRSSKNLSPSLDRLIPSLGYVKGNVQVISWRANRLKLDASLDELERLVDWLRRAIAGRQSTQPGEKRGVGDGSTGQPGA